MALLSEGTWQIYNEQNEPDRYFVTLTQENVNDARNYYTKFQSTESGNFWKFGEKYTDGNPAFVLPEATIEFTRENPDDVNNTTITGMNVTPVYNGDGMFENGVLRGGRKRSKKVKKSKQTKKRATRRRRSSKKAKKAKKAKKSKKSRKAKKSRKH